MVGMSILGNTYFPQSENRALLFTRNARQIGNPQRFTLSIDHTRVTDSLCSCSSIKNMLRIRRKIQNHRKKFHLLQGKHVWPLSLAMTKPARQRHSPSAAFLVNDAANCSSYVTVGAVNASLTRCPEASAVEATAVQKLFAIPAHCSLTLHASPMR